MEVTICASAKGSHAQHASIAVGLAESDSAAVNNAIVIDTGAHIIIHLGIKDQSR